MKELKCPFCQQELEEETFFGGRVFVSCNNPNCIISDWGGCSKQIITELIRTRKALDVARHTIGWVNQMIDEHVDKQAIKIKCEYALEQITALEQKE